MRRLAAESPVPRIILETDAPFMVPSNVYGAIPTFRGRLPLSHTAMIPWTAEFVAGVAGDGWDTGQVLRLGMENAAKLYGV